MKSGRLKARRMARLADLEKKIGYVFKNADILKEALTHRSYLNENPEWPLPHNERLEYLGDAVLELITTEFLFRKFPRESEGQLTSFRAALVNYQILSRIARKAGFERFMHLSRGEARDTGRAREVILANAFEALVGSLYLDGGYEAARAFVERMVLSHIDEIIEKGLYRDPKSLLQEIVQERRKVTPIYRVLAENGPDHQRQFVLGVFFGDEQVATGSGASKQEAETRAAEAALELFKKGILR